MRTKTIFILSVVMTICSMAGCFAQENAATNRYSMKLTRNDDGTYSLQKKERYAKIISSTSVITVIQTRRDKVSVWKAWEWRGEASHGFRRKQLAAVYSSAARIVRTSV